jgi:hypothetical protein
MPASPPSAIGQRQFHRIGNGCLHEQGFTRQPIEMRRIEPRIAVRTEKPGPQAIDHDHDRALLRAAHG